MLSIIYSKLSFLFLIFPTVVNNFQHGTRYRDSSTLSTHLPDHFVTFEVMAAVSELQSQKKLCWHLGFVLKVLNESIGWNSKQNSRQLELQITQDTDQNSLQYIQTARRKVNTYWKRKKKPCKWSRKNNQWTRWCFYKFLLVGGKIAR